MPLATAAATADARRLAPVAPRGTEWGEDGFLRLVTSDNTGPLGTGNNLVETECTMATPDRYAKE